MSFISKKGKSSMKKVLAVALFVVSYLVSSAQAVETNKVVRSGISVLEKKEKDELEAWASVMAVSKYVANGAVFYGGRSIQTEVGVGYKGWSFSLWHQTPMDKGSLNNVNAADYRNEIDLTLSKSFEVKGFNVKVSMSYFNFVDLSRFSQDALAPALEISRVVRVNDTEITPYASVEFDIPTPGSTYDGGTFVQAGVRQSVELKERVTFSHDTAFFKDDGAYGYQPGYFFQYEPSLTWKLSENVSLVMPKLTVYVPIARMSDGRNAGTVFSGGVNLSF